MQGSINFKLDHKLVRDLVNFGVPVGNAWLDSKKHQTILLTGRGKVIKLNCSPVYLNGQHVDIVDMLHKLIMNILFVKDVVPTKTELKTNKCEEDNETLLSDLALLKQHVKLCMTSFSNYFMVTKTETTDLNTKKSIECLEIIAAMIVEQNVLMTKGNERALIHCICVTPDLR